MTKLVKSCRVGKEQQLSQTFWWVVWRWSEEEVQFVLDVVLILLLPLRAHLSPQITC